MTREEVAEIVHGMPQGMDADDYLVELVNRALAKREWVGLDEVEVTGMTCECVDDGTFNMDCAYDFARAIEESLRGRNT